MLSLSVLNVTTLSDLACTNNAKLCRSDIGNLPVLSPYLTLAESAQIAPLNGVELTGFWSRI